MKQWYALYLFQYSIINIAQRFASNTTHGILIYLPLIWCWQLSFNRGYSYRGNVCIIAAIDITRVNFWCMHIYHAIFQAKNTFFHILLVTWYYNMLYVISDILLHDIMWHDIQHNDIQSSALHKYNFNIPSFITYQVPSHTKQCKACKLCGIKYIYIHIYAHQCNFTHYVNP